MPLRPTAREPPQRPSTPAEGARTPRARADSLGRGAQAAGWGVA